MNKMKTLQSLLIVYISVVFYIAKVQNSCIWYKQCDAVSFLNCRYSGEAIPLHSETALSKLMDLCYDLDIGQDNETCCDSKMVDALEQSLGTAETLLKSCPSCFKNFAKNFCFMTCSPNQSEYLRVKKTKEIAHNKTLVTAIDYYMSETYAEGMFNSCKNVIFGPAHKPAMDLMCYGQKKCNAKTLLFHIGHSPINHIKIDYHLSDTSSHDDIFPMNATVIPCSKPYKEGATPCKCKDCPTSPKCG